ncbi:putative ribonuclease H-like domain-containing protein [Tanacetum coccineum]
MEILVKTCLMLIALKTQNDSFAFVHELKQEMHADLKYVESLEDEIDELESDKAEFSNMYDMLLQECVSKDVMCSYLQSSSDLDEITELQCLYLHKVRECDCLTQKLSEQTKFVNFKLANENHVLLKVPRKDNMYSVNLKNIVPKIGLTFLYPKATSNEANLWHRRIGHQNGVPKKKNRTLIEVARTMLADSKLPTTFWAEAVNTACYVQNRVLVIKPHNKTPYELFFGRKPTLGFMRPFGCPITIINTIDHLGNQNNGSAGTKACQDAGKVGLEKEDNDASDDQDKEDNVNSINTLNTASTKEVNAAGAKTGMELPNDPNMPPLQEIVYFEDEEDVSAQADITNLDSHILVSPILTTIIHKDHPLDQVIRDVHLVTQTRRMSKKMDEHGLEEGIDYDEVFVPVARIKAIRLFLAYASYMDFVVYQMDVKSAFLYGTNLQNVAFVSSNSTTSTSAAVNTAQGVNAASTQATTENSTMVDSLSDALIYSFFANQPRSSQLDSEDLQQIHPDDIEEIDLKWQMAMLTMRARRFLKRTRRKLEMTDKETFRFNNTKESRYTKKTIPVETTTSNALVSQCDGFGYDWSDQAEEGLNNFALMAYSSTSSSSSKSEVSSLESVEARLLVYQKNESVFGDKIILLKHDVLARDNAIANSKED